MELIPWLVAVYAAICAVVYFGNRLFMYFPDPTRVAPAEAGLDHVKEIEIAAGNGIHSDCLAFTGEGRQADHPLLPRQRGERRQPRIRIELIRENGFGVLYLNNRGYGGSGGRPTEEDNVADAIATYDHLIGLGVLAARIVAYGESLGSGQAARSRKAGRRGRAGGAAHLDGRCCAEHLFLAPASFADRRQI
jgi:hypothetical protein